MSPGDLRTEALQHRETELRALVQQLDEENQHGWVVRYRYLGGRGS
jgi:hypothetical protein